MRRISKLIFSIKLCPVQNSLKPNPSIMTVYTGLIGLDNAVIPECAEEDVALGYNIDFLLQRLSELG